MSQELPKVRKLEETRRNTNIKSDVKSLSVCVDCGEPSDDLYCDTPYQPNLGPLCQECFNLIFDK